jgi:hypothetical protein
MAAELPYLASYKNVETLFQRIASAKRPDTFSTRFLSETIGLKSTSDRPLISLLRTLGFIDATGKPTNDYDALKNPARAPYAIGTAVRRAYGPLFAANEAAHDLPPDELRGLISQVAGTDESMTKRIAYTLGALLKVAKFNGLKDKEQVEPDPVNKENSVVPEVRGPNMRPEFHYNIQVHVPANGTEETYINIFNAIRKVFR